jgi:hypothetical protein
MATRSADTDGPLLDEDEEVILSNTLPDKTNSNNNNNHNNPKNKVDTTALDERTASPSIESISPESPLFRASTTTTTTTASTEALISSSSSSSLLQRKSMNRTMKTREQIDSMDHQEYDLRENDHGEETGARNTTLTIPPTNNAVNVVKSSDSIDSNSSLPGSSGENANSTSSDENYGENMNDIDVDEEQESKEREKLLQSTNTQTIHHSDDRKGSFLPSFSSSTTATTHHHHYHTASTNDDAATGIPSVHPGGNENGNNELDHFDFHYLDDTTDQYEEIDENKLQNLNQHGLVDVDDDDLDEDEQDEFPDSLVYHHGRQPSTIVEEFSQKGEEEDIITNHSVEQHHPKTLHQTDNPEDRHPLLQNPRSPPRSLAETRNSRMDDIQRSRNFGDAKSSSVENLTSLQRQVLFGERGDPLEFHPHYAATRALQWISKRVLPAQHVPGVGAATWIGFWALLHVTCANYVLTPMRDAIALQVGVQHIPKLTLASTVLALFSSVPIGWLFEAPDPCRRRLWKRMGLTRGETQGTSLALFYRIFAIILISYAIGFQGIEFIRAHYGSNEQNADSPAQDVQAGWLNLTKIWASIGQILYIAFFLVVHLMKLHCLSLVWGVTSEAMEYEDVARKHSKHATVESNKMRLQRLSLTGFGGTVGGIAGSFLASRLAQLFRLPGLLLLAALLLEISAELSIELGRIMQKHWEGQQQLFQSTCDLASLDASMKRSASMGSMKRISSGNSLNRVKSTSDLGHKPVTPSSSHSSSHGSAEAEVNEDTFTQRLLRGLQTIVKSRLLMAVFTYNALYASTTVLLSFQRAALVASRKDSTSVQADTAFLANINMASSLAVFLLQASGTGAYVAHTFGSRGTLTLMPLIRLTGVLALAWWHRFSRGQPPNLMVFLIVDEACKIMNLAVAKPVRESLWRGLSNEARYEAKPIVDTLANRWGGGSAAFLVSFVDKTLDLFGVSASAPGGIRSVFGFPPVLFLCVIISAWWAGVSFDLGNIRRKIDLELKKRQ